MFFIRRTAIAAAAAAAGLVATAAARAEFIGGLILLPADADADADAETCFYGKPDRIWGVIDIGAAASLEPPPGSRRAPTPSSRA